MCKFIGKSNERILCKLSKSEILRLYSIVHVAMETTKMTNFTCQSKSFISIFFTCQVSACELQRFSCHNLPNDIYSQTAKTVFSNLKISLSLQNISTQGNGQHTMGGHCQKPCPWTPSPSSSFYLAKKGLSVFQPSPNRMEGLPYLKQR